MPTPEAHAREQIDAMLVTSGWVVQDFTALNLGIGQGIALREVPLKSGRCDYLLLVDRKPFGVIEAKRAGTTLSTVADQSGHYAENLPEFLAPLLPGTHNPSHFFTNRPAPKHLPGRTRSPSALATPTCIPSTRSLAEHSRNPTPSDNSPRSHSPPRHEECARARSRP